MVKRTKKTTRKKATAKSGPKTGRSKSAANQPVGFWQRLKAGVFYLLCGCFGLLAGATGVWVYNIDQQVISHFEQWRWDLPSRVYARPLVLAVGDSISKQQLAVELNLAGYRETGNPSQPGEYSLSTQPWQLVSRPFVFDDGPQPAQRLSIGVKAQRINTLKRDGSAVNLVRLDPAEIGSIHALSGEDRKVLSIEQFPSLLVTGVQSIEDRNFKHHHGVDFRGLARAMVSNIRSGALRQGGSTITQQLARNLYLNHDRTIWRKLNEMIMAVSLERRFSKREILETYLNEVYMGQHAGRPIHGFVRASEHYFGSPVQSLQPDQIALLIGMVRGASWYNPRRNPERALQRRNVVLSSFAQTGLLPASQLDDWQARSLGVRDNRMTRTARYPAFMDLVRQQLRSVYKDDDLQHDGLRIMTTLDPYQQYQAEQAVNELANVEKRLNTSDLQTGIVTLDPQTGDVLAMVGDRQPNRVGFNRALQAKRQIGSVVKPFVYLQALDEGYTLATLVDDTPVDITLDNGDHWQPQNYDQKNHGRLNLLQNLVNSYNQATVRLGMHIGVERVRNLLVDLELLQSGAAANPSLLLGALEATPLEVAAAYQPLAASGYRAPTSAVRDVLDNQGQALSRYNVRMESLPQRQSIHLLTYALTETSKQGTAKSLPRYLGRSVDVAAKTGTTNDKRDSWFVAYSADKLSVVWVGRDDNQAANITGASAALPVWAAIYKDQLIHSIDISRLPNLVWYWVDETSGLLTEPECSNAQVLPFIPRTEPRQWAECYADSTLAGYGMIESQP